MLHLTFRSWRRLAAALTVVALVGACASKDGKLPAGTAQPDKFLFDQGTEALNKKKWLRAREYFQQLVDNYPQSTYRPDAKLGLGDTYLGENTTESVILAVNEFREYLTFYPTGKRNDYAQFKLGVAHYAQMLGPQRDQTQTKEAVKEFEMFVQRFPNSPLVGEGRKKLRECKDRIGDSEAAVGVFYWRSRWYPGAVDRLKGIIDRDPEFSNRDQVYYYLADSLVKMKLEAQAIPYLDRLLKEFVQSEYLERAKKLMAELKNAQPDKAPPKAGQEPAPPKSGLQPVPGREPRH
jgi:outer membrane protein assembly factor BamD